MVVILCSIKNVSMCVVGVDCKEVVYFCKGCGSLDRIFFVWESLVDDCGGGGGGKVLLF